MDEKLPEYSLNEIEIGFKKNFEITITESMFHDIAKLSGHYNPLHMNEEYASSTSFKKRVCSGMFLATFFSRLVGMYLPGKHALYFSQSLNFVNPCFIGDTLKISGTITKKTSATKMLTLNTEIHNQNKDCVVNGVAKVIVRD